MKYVDNFLNGITMYKLVLYGLSILALLSVIFGFVGALAYGGLSLACTLVTLLFSCFFTNYVLAKLFKVQTNVESAWITAFILFFLVFPVSSYSDFGMVFVIGVIAMASKYILAIKKKHLFNPAAISIFIVSLFGWGMSAWWVGSSVLILPVIIIGFLVLRKVQRFEMFLIFLLVGTVSLYLFSRAGGESLTSFLSTVFLSGPILFLGVVMLTEPLTTPPDRNMRIAYGALVGVLVGVQFHLSSFSASPEFALIAGNLFSYFVSPHIRLRLKLAQKNKLSKDVYEFIWQINHKSNRNIVFKPGQYFEWTLAHSSPDSRGNRRYFTIASSPTEQEIHLGTKFFDKSSSFKKKLLELNVGDTILASQLAGEFVMPVDKSKKLVFIAGGIGVTPFRSMIKFLSDTGEKRDVVLFYSNRTQSDIVYKNIFDEAEQKIGLKTVYAVNELADTVPTSNMRVGFINADMIVKEVPDYKERIFYISGPNSMVTTFEKVLSGLGVPVSNIKTDFFPGFA